MTRCTASQLIFFLAFAIAGVVGANSRSPEEVKQRWISRLDGRHFTAKIVLIVNHQGQPEERRVTVWRDDENAKRERVMARFEEPFDLRGLALLYIENFDRPNDYFLYQPATRRVRRIAEALAREDIYGIDLEYLGFGLAQQEPTSPETLDYESVAGQPALRLTESATGPHPRFDRRITWLDPETYIPLQTIQYRGKDIVLQAHTDEIKIIQGVPTPIKLSFEHTEGEKVTMVVESIDYEAPIAAQYFSTLAMAMQLR